jgi:hypothetical protein
MKTSFSLITLLVFFTIAGCEKETIVQENPDHNNKLQITIPNGDFENWDPGFWLSDWQTNSCPLCLPAYETYIVRQDSTPYHGLFAAMFIFNNAYASWAKNKFPVPYHPVQLSAYVKCNLVAYDSVLIKVTLFHNSVACDSGQWFGTTQIGSYSPVVIPISQYSAMADTCVIYIRGGQKTYYSPTNTEFWVDDMKLQ